MSADLLWAAATKLREAAEATYREPWTVEREAGVGHVVTGSGGWVAPIGDHEGARQDATYIALANPVFGLAVADWLEHDARVWEESEKVGRRFTPARAERSMAVAHSIVGDPS